MSACCWNSARSRCSAAWRRPAGPQGSRPPRCLASFAARPGRPRRRFGGVGPPLRLRVHTPTSPASPTAPWPRATPASPVYPFQRQRYWSTPQPHNTPNHTLPGHQLTSPALTDTVYQTTLNTNTHPLLTQHRIYNQNVIPGAHHLTILHAATTSDGAPPPTLTDMLFPQPLLLAEGRDRVVQTIVRQSEDGQSAVELLSRDGDDGEPAWITHATGTVRPGTAGAGAGERHEPPAAIQERCEHDPDYVDWMYAAAWEQRLELDAGFRWQSEMWRGEREALCRMRQAQAADALGGQYELHPGLIDASFQIVGATLPSAGQDFSVFVPLGIEQFRIHGRAASTVWGHARLRSSGDPHEETITADVWLIDDDGNVTVEVLGLHLKRAERSALLGDGELGSQELLHDVTWRPAPAAASPAPPAGGRWIVYADRHGIGEAVGGSLRARGEQALVVYRGDSYNAADDGAATVDPAVGEHLARLIRDVSAASDAPLRGVVDLWSLDADGGEPTLGELEQAHACALRAVLHTTQALAGLGTSVPPRLYLATRGAVPAGAASAGLGPAPLWGLGNVIELEHPELWGGQIDLDPEATVPAAADALAVELLAAPTGDRVALRDGERLVARLVRRPPSAVAGAGLALDGIATYLITGGLGALGLAVARWLAAHGAQHLVLVGRSAPSDAAAAAVDELRGRGVDVRTPRADCADPGELAEVLRAIPEQTPLRGVIHAAGVLDDSVLVRQAWERFAGVLRPKVSGAWNLHRLTRETPLDFFVLFSSAASLLGSAGQAGYAAANAFLDGLAHWRRARGLLATSINWGPWTEAGMAAAAGPRDGRWAAQGVGGISPEQGTELLAQILQEAPVQVGVLPVAWRAYIGRFAAGAEPALLRDLARTARARKSPVVRLVDELEAAPAEARFDLLLAGVRAEAVAVLGFDPTVQLDARQKLFDLGLDSLMAIELKNGLQTQLGKPLPSTLVFEYPTVHALARYLASDVLALYTSTAEPAEQPASDRSQEIESLSRLSENELEQLLTEKLEGLAHRRRT